MAQLVDLGARRRSTAAPPRTQPAWHADPGMRDTVFRRLLVVADLAAGIATLIAIGALQRHGFNVLALIAGLLIVPLAKMMGRYDREAVVLRKSTLDEFPGVMMLAAAFALTWSLISAIAPHEPQGARTVAIWGIAVVLLTLARSTARSIARSTAPTERVLIVGNRSARTRLAHALASDPSARLDVVGFLPFDEEPDARPAGAWANRRAGERTFADLSRVIRELTVHRVFLVPTSAEHEAMLVAVGRANAIGVKITIVPSLLEVVGSAVEFDSVGGVTVLGVRQPGLSRSSRALKRSVDVVGAGIGLLLLSPVIAAVAIAIKLDSRGPVFFRQARVGRDGETFRMVKFRSMIDGAEAQRAALQSLNETVGLFKLSADPRVTRVGRLLRSTSLDELPQLFNVIRGSMSLVGPRPLVLEEDVLIEGHHRLRLTLAPGMTGPWQVLGPSRPPLSEMAKTDYLYAANWSLWTDLKILVRTFAHMTARRGV